LNLTSKSKKKIENSLTAGIDKMGHHRALPFLGDEPARLDSAHVFTGGGRLQPALVGDLLEGKTGLGADQLENPDPVLVGEGFGHQGQAGQGVGLVNQIHKGLNFEKGKRMRSNFTFFSSGRFRGLWVSFSLSRPILFRIPLPEGGVRGNSRKVEKRWVHEI